MRLLLIEGSDSLRHSLTVGLSRLSFSVDSSGDGAEGLNMALVGDYDLIILDILLPNLDGKTVLKILRESGNQAKILILSAVRNSSEKAKSLFAGADDYLEKPFSLDELHARLLSLMRRGNYTGAIDVHNVGDLSLNLQIKEVKYRDVVISLTPNEYKIIECLFLRKNKIISTDVISEYISGSFDSISKNSIEAHISSVRRKVKLLGGELPIRNRRSFGYVAQSEV